MKGKMIIIVLMSYVFHFMGSQMSANSMTLHLPPNLKYLSVYKSRGLFPPQ